MFSMETHVQIPGLDRFDKEGIRKAQLKLRDRWKDVCEPYVPKKYGFLRGNVKLESEDTIVYQEKYAVYVYYMQNANFSTPGTSGFWDEKAKADHLHDMEDFVLKEILEGD